MELQHFWKNLTILKKFSNLPAKDLSDKIGLKPLKRYADFEDGRGYPTLDEVDLISRHFGITLDSLLYRDLKVTIE